MVLQSVDSQDQVQAVGEFLGNCHRQCAGGGGCGGGGEADGVGVGVAMAALTAYVTLRLYVRD